MRPECRSYVGGLSDDNQITWPTVWSRDEWIEVSRQVKPDWTDDELGWAWDEMDALRQRRAAH